MSAVFIYITTATIAEARSIADTVIKDRLAACANIHPSMTSICHWEGKMTTSEEVVLVFKTRAELFPAVEARVKELHSYKNPCIVALPVTAGSASYLDWILAETKP